MWRRVECEAVWLISFVLPFVGRRWIERKTRAMQAQIDVLRAEEAELTGRVAFQDAQLVVMHEQLRALGLFDVYLAEMNARGLTPRLLDSSPSFP